MRRPAIIEASSNLGLSSRGVEMLAQRLLEFGLAERIGALPAGRVEAPAPSGKRDPSTTVLNAPEIAAYALKLADAIGRVLDDQRFPIVLGGDCTILLGSMLALRRRGRYGLLFIDGHADFFQPQAEPNGEGASMDLAWVTGHGPDVVTHFEGYRPLVKALDVVAVGYRDHRDQEEYGSQPIPPELATFDLPAIRAIGVEAAMTRAVAHLEGSEIDGFFIHLDADVLDDAIMPAVDFRIPRRPVMG